MTAGNYSYRANVSWGEGYMMIGDAFAFVDPVFSSGVMLAMTAGELGADVANTWLDDPAAGRKLARQSERQLCRTMDRLSWLIYRINSPVLRGMLMAPRNCFRMRDGLVSVLAGNLDDRAELPNSDPGVQDRLLFAVDGRSPGRADPGTGSVRSGQVMSATIALFPVRRAKQRPVTYQ